VSKELTIWRKALHIERQPVKELVVKQAARLPAVTTAKAEVISSGAGDVIDLPRICAVHDKPYAARYVRGNDGVFRHAQTIRVTETLGEQYTGNGIGLSSKYWQEESCPWCGAHGSGSIQCGRCRYEICHGKTQGKFFRCRNSCGSSGNIVSEDRTQEGFKPSLRGPGGYAAG
jgi:hypothetical protein